MLKLSYTLFEFTLRLFYNLVKKEKENIRANSNIRKRKTCLDCGKSFAGTYNFKRHLPCETEFHVDEQSDGPHLIEFIHTNVTPTESITDFAPITDVSKSMIVVEDNANGTSFESVTELALSPDVSKSIIGVEDNTNATELR